MFDIVTQFNMMGILLIALTMYFIIQDKAFKRHIRICFHITSLLCLYLIIISNCLMVSSFAGGWLSKDFVRMNEILIRPIVLALLVYISTKIKNSKRDYIFSMSVIGFILVVFLAEQEDTPANMVNNLMCLATSSIYIYNVLQIYKKDGLTKLFLRNNLTFDMEDLAKRLYYIVLIDVDNFKLINDKYGHDRGDAVLVTIVNAVLKYLPKGCKLYRYGGDEFVVISKIENEDSLLKVFEKINTELMNDELRISYGIVAHNPGDDGEMSINEADKKMYENKKLLKSEDIWDDMTGLYNYRGFIDELDSFRNAVVKDNHSICLLAVDVDRLSNINLAYGYTEGNLVIKTLARIIKLGLRGRDFIGHLGSDEFAVAVECSDEDRVNEFIDELTNGIGGAFEFANKDYSLKINVSSLAISNEDKSSSEELVNNVLYAKETDKEDRRKTDIESVEDVEDDKEELTVKDILDNNRFRYAFQPIVSAKDGEIVAYESLMRSDTDIMISPLKILKYAEKNKRLYDVEKYTFFNVLDKVKTSGCLGSKRRVFINSIPGFGLNDSDYEKLKNNYGDFFERMVIEITEQREIDDETLATINSRRDIGGFNLAIDDYGSGCSNTNSLLRYMPQVVKLDRLLITGIDRNSKKQFFVNSIISFARENDMQILAEGVETESELKTVIRLGVDMVQGFYTAKPSFDVIDSIPQDVKKIIVDENLKVSGNQRMVYTASSNCELSAIHLAMEDYSKINISAESVKLIGNAEYTADIVIKIKDGVTTKLTLADVSLNSVDDEPCIEVGEGAHLILKLEGTNRFNAKGIHVPEGSELTLVGTGNLEIKAKGRECYCIGADYESGFGKLTFNNSGSVKLSLDGENCVGIGGGIAEGNSSIDFTAGAYTIDVAGLQAVGIGYYNGLTNISMKDCWFNSVFRVNKGVILGSYNGDQNIDIQNFKMDFEGSGTEVIAIGSSSGKHGRVTLSSGKYNIKLNGQRLVLLGSKDGQLDVEMHHVKADMIGEGDNVIGFGSADNQSHLKSKDSSLSLVINASAPNGFCVVEDNTGFDNHNAIVKINGVAIKMG